MNNSRLRRYFVAYCIGLILGYVLYIPGRRLPGFPAGGPGDFANLYTGGRVVLEGQARFLYDLDVQSRVQQSLLLPHGWQFEGGLLPFNSPPFVALLIAPFALIPLSWAYHAWNLLSVGVLIFCVRTFTRSYTTSTSSLTSTVVVFSFFPVFEALWQGQSSFIVLLALTLAFLAVKAGREGTAGICLCLGLVKPHLILVPLLVFLFLKRWRLLLTFVIGGAGLSALSWILVGTQGLISYITLIQSMLRWSTLQVMQPSSLPNLRGTVYRLWAVARLQPGEGTASAWCSVLGVMLTVCILVLVIRAWKSDWQARSSVYDIRFAFTIVSGLFLSPYLRGHDLSLLVLPGFLTLSYFDHKGMASDGNRILCLGHAGLTFPYLFPFGPDLRAQVISFSLAGLMILLGRQAWRAHGTFAARQHDGPACI